MQCWSLRPVQKLQSISCEDLPQAWKFAYMNKRGPRRICSARAHGPSEEAVPGGCILHSSAETWLSCRSLGLWQRSVSQPCFGEEVGKWVLGGCDLTPFSQAFSIPVLWFLAGTKANSSCVSWGVSICLPCVSGAAVGLSVSGVSGPFISWEGWEASCKPCKPCFRPEQALSLPGLSCTRAGQHHAPCFPPSVAFCILVTSLTLQPVYAGTMVEFWGAESSLWSTGLLWRLWLQEEWTKLTPRYGPALQKSDVRLFPKVHLFLIMLFNFSISGFWVL